MSVMRPWMIGSLAALALIAGCKKTACPKAEPCPAAEPCPKADCNVAVEDAGKKGAALAYRLVEHGGKLVMTAVGTDGKAIAIPLDEKAGVYLDGKRGTVGEVLLGPGGASLIIPGGGCPCRLPACREFCHPVQAVLDKPVGDLFPGAGGPPGGGVTDPVPPAPPPP